MTWGNIRVDAVKKEIHNNFTNLLLACGRKIKGAKIVNVVPMLIRAAVCAVFHADFCMDAAGVPTSVCER